MLTELACERNRMDWGASINNIIPYQVDPTSVGVQTGWADANNVTLTLHGGQVNYLFADGHVEAFNFNDPKIYGTGTPDNPRGIWTVDPSD